MIAFLAFKECLAIRNGRNPATLLQSDTTKRKKKFDEKKTIKNVKITKQPYAYKGYASADDLDILNSFNPEIQLKNNESPIRNKPRDLLSELTGFKFVTALVIKFQKIESDDATKYSPIYSNSQVETIINESDIDDVPSMILSKIQKSLGIALGWIIDSVINPLINISKYDPLDGSSYIKLPKELDHSKKI